MTPRQQPPEGRVCAEPDCATVLSRYNRREWCGAHEDAHPQRWVRRNPGTARTRATVSEGGR